MNEPESPYPGHRFPREIVSHAGWLYYRFGLSLRDVEDLLAERHVIVSYEKIRQWSRKFGLDYARRANNRAEVSHEAVRFRERQMRGFKPGRHAQRFLSVLSVVGNLFQVGRQKVSAANYRMLRDRSFGIWREVSCIG